MNFKYKLGVIGAGNMAKAIVSGIVKNNVLSPKEILVSDPFSDIGISGVQMTKDNNEVFYNSQFVILAIKPQIFKEITACIPKDIPVLHIISIMAGIDTAFLAKAFSCNITRIMPNTPCKLGLGMSAITNNDAPEEEKQFVSSIFSSIGEVVYLDESAFHTVTSISGSGPAYVYMFIQGMIKSGVQQGIDYQTAKKMVIQTFKGATEMVANSEESIDDLIDAVCSKGGTTIQAVDSFKEDNLYEIINKGMIKCRNRSEELSR